MDVLAATVAWLVDPAHWEGPDGVPLRLAEHLAISVPSVLAAALVALPAGAWTGHTGRGAAVAINLANLGRAVPSYAVLAIVLPISLRWSPDLGLSVIPTFTAMVLLAIPPILVASYAGLQQVDGDLKESSRGMGMSERQVLTRVELPLASPVIVGGFRIALLQVIATATIGAFLAGGGLGRYIIDGIARRDDGMLYSGVLLVMILAIGTDVGLSQLQKRLTPKGVRVATDPLAGNGAGATASSTAGPG